MFAKFVLLASVFWQWIELIIIYSHSYRDLKMNFLSVWICYTIQTADYASKVRTPNILLWEEEETTALLYCLTSNRNDKLGLDLLLLG